MEEVWKDIKGYENYYQVSNLGRVKGIDRKNSRGNFVKGRILKPNIDRDGYRTVSLQKNGKVKRLKISRLVALAFIPNQDNKPIVNHLDETKDNDKIDNLEWATAKENINYGTAIQRRAKTISIPIKVIYSDGTYEIWESATVFAREYGNGAQQQHIVSVLKGRRQTHLGLRFEYATSEEK